MKRGLLFFLALFLLPVAFLSLFPFTALPLLTGMYTVGLSADPKGWHILGAIRGAAVIGGIWALSSTLRLKN